MRWLPVLLVLCLLGGIVGARWLGGDDPPAPSTADAPPATEAADTANPVQRAPWDDGAGDPESGSGETGPEPTPGDEDRADASGDEPAIGARRVVVVRGEPPVPVADAEVLFLDERQGQQRVRGLEPQPPRNEWPDRWGQRLRTDAEGVALVRGPGGTLLVAARSGDEFAFAPLRSNRQQVVLTLVADEQVTVQVRRIDERPAAQVPLALLQWHGAGEADAIWRGESGADGQVVVHHFQLYRRPLRQADAAERFAAIAVVPAPGPVLAEFVGRPATDAPVRLQLPPAGEVEVVLTDHRGTPLLSPAWVVVRHRDQTDAAGPFPLSQALLHRGVRKPPGEAPLRLPWIGANADLQVSAHFDADRRGTSTTASGPDHDGATARVSLPLGERQVVLAGRVLQPDGTPCASATLSAVVWDAARDRLATHVTCVEDGRFDLVMPGRGGDGPFALQVRHRSPAADSQPQELGARTHVPELTGGRRVELGDLVLGLLPPLVAGLVTDDLGAAIGGAAVQVQVHDPEQKRGEPWRNLPQLGTRTADDGTFRVCGERPPGELRVRADTDRHFAASQPLQTQGQQVALRLDRNGIVRGQALLPDWVADDVLSLVLQPVDGALRKDHTRSTPLRRRTGGRFTIEPLRPGRFDALVTVRNVATPALTIVDCFVPPGESRDPRLQHLDLREVLFRYRLRAVDSAGQPAALDGPIQATLSLPDGTRVESGFRWQRGRAELITPSALAELLFFGRGFVPQRLTLGPGDHDVYLQTLRPALLELPGARALCGPDRRVRVSVILTEATGLPESLGGIDQRTGERFSFARWDLGRSSGAWLEHYNTVEVPLMRSGSYEVVLRVHATASERSPQASVSLGTFALQVDAPSLLPVRVPVDAAAVQEACRSVDERLHTAADASARPR